VELCCYGCSFVLSVDVVVVGSGVVVDVEVVVGSGVVVDVEVVVGSGVVVGVEVVVGSGVVVGVEVVVWSGVVVDVLVVNAAHSWVVHCSGGRGLDLVSLSDCAEVFVLCVYGHYHEVAPRMPRGLHTWCGTSYPCVQE
jgi:NDP-sugar pyrophosphorylase family protein